MSIITPTNLERLVLAGLVIDLVVGASESLVMESESSIPPTALCCTLEIKSNSLALKRPNSTVPCMSALSSNRSSENLVRLLIEGGIFATILKTSALQYTPSFWPVTFVLKRIRTLLPTANHFSILITSSALPNGLFVAVLCALTVRYCDCRIPFVAGLLIASVWD